MEQGRAYLPGGPLIEPAPLVDVLKETNGVLAPLPVFDSLSMRTDSLDSESGGTESMDTESMVARKVQRMLSIGAPFVLRNHPAAALLTRDGKWRDPVTLCNAYSTFCENEGNQYEFKGWQMQYRDTGLLSDSEMDKEVYSYKYGLHKANITRTSLATHLTSAPNARASIAMDVPLDSILANQSSLLEALSVENLAGVMPGEVSSVTAALRMRVGRQAYGSNLHFDPSHNWVLAVAGQKRAVLLHLFESECLHIDMNSTCGSYRQSALPVRAALAWLDAHCTANEFAEPIALQHCFQEGDLLFIPANWIHYIETGPSTSGWWLSLNRHFNVDVLDIEGQPIEVCGPWQIQNDGTLQWRPPVRRGPVERANDPSPSDIDIEDPVPRVARPWPDHPPADQAVIYSLDMNNGRLARQDEVHPLTNLSLHVAYPYDGQVIHLPAPYMVKMSLITVGLEGTATLSVDSQASLCLKLDRYERRQCLPRPKLVKRVCYMVDVQEWRVPRTLRLSGRVDLEMLGLHQLVENGSSWVRLSARLNGVQARPSLVWVDLKRHAVRTSAVRWRGRSIALSALAGEHSAAQLLRRYARAFDLS